ncbi:phage putative head morphogenesis protein, SPP1 gp7 family [Hathewaya proteolytica DSM 3090]|uniref:Phage putative head morphogenesis protein, SPP1 gp7 family n=2 Tax=Hathewaya proteolytica TaxID=29365 RepID=A0A1M6L1B0_9CLOT|nr:phage putative head morphogenesis protein, SPP1 gp7 family [Hathewaya proteolytica DSM 3090]
MINSIDKFTDKQIRQQLLVEYKRSLNDMYSVTDELFRKYSTNGELSLSELYKYNRYKKLQDEIKNIMYDLGKTENNFTDKHLLETYNNTIDFNISELNKQGININVKSFAIPVKQVEKSLSYPWSGADYSSRIWDNKNKLVKNLQQTITQGIIQGKSNTNMAKDLKGVMDKGAYECRRLVRTETMHIVNSATHDSYSKVGIEKVQILIENDERTCDECMEYDGVIFNIDEAPTLPIHANCRCCLIAVIE